MFEGMGRVPHVRIRLRGAYVGRKTMGVAPNAFC